MITQHIVSTRRACQHPGQSTLGLCFQNEILPSLRQLGVRISIDDFGTGFSSLSILADIDADELKVDRAFIMSIHERPRSQDILKAIESVCATLGIGMVAEGVELREELPRAEYQNPAGSGLFLLQAGVPRNIPDRQRSIGFF